MKWFQFTIDYHIKWFPANQNLYTQVVSTDHKPHIQVVLDDP